MIYKKLITPPICRKLAHTTIFTNKFYILTFLFIFIGLFQFAHANEKITKSNSPAAKKISQTFSAFTLSQSTPTKILTPNADGVNDSVTLTFDNPSGNILKQKKVYDLTGAEVADLKVLGQEIDTTVLLSWDGKDHSGVVVRSGIYIYQVQAEGKVINGTIVVAR